MTNLSVNVNKIAWLRNARGEDRPNLIETSKILIEAGIQGLTVHPRPDLRHITPDDVYDLSLLCKDHDIEFNIEGNPYSEETTLYPGFVQLVKAIEPDQCTLVPDAIDQLTSDHGWNIHSEHNKLKEVLNYLKQNNIRSSVFIDPDISQIDAAKDIGVDRVEIYTGPFAEAFEKKDENALITYREAIEYANEINLEVNAGHDLNLENLSTLLSYGDIKEVSIGHALISESLIYGIETVSYTHLRAPRDQRGSRMPSSA